LTRPRIVILGGGYGGAYCARALRGADADVLLLDRNNYFVFYPLLVEAGTGSLEPRHAVVPIRDFTRSAEFRQAEVLGVDLDGRTVAYRLVGADATRQADYDHLVIALGSVTRMPADVPGLHAHGFEMKSLADAVALRDRAIQMLELADATEDEAVRRELLHMVVVGGNFTGAEVAGEYDMFVRRAAKHYRHVRADECRVTLLELGDRILAPLGTELSSFATRHMRRRGIDVRPGTTVTAVHPRRVELSDGDVLASRTLIWCAGIRPVPLQADLGLPVDERGYLRCERDLRVTGHDHVWAIGDGAVNRDADGRPYPATAQHAVGQGAHVARNIAAVIGGRPTRPCDLPHLGSLAALGCRTGVARVLGIRLSGFPAWWLWRTVYLLKMPRLGRKVRVALDWTIDLLFSRDYVQLGLHRRERRDAE
jgi:NADH dehydrogenase